MPRSPRPLSALLILTLALAALIGLQAWRAARRHRDTAERVMHDYAAAAAWTFSEHAITAMNRSVLEALSPVYGAAMRPASLPLPEPGILRAHADTVATCNDRQADADRYYFRMDFATGAVVSDGAPVTSDLKRIIADSVRHRVSHDRESWYLAPLVRSAHGRPRALVYAVARAPDGTAVAAYGWETCNDAVWAAAFQFVMLHAPMLPPTLIGDVPNDSLLSVQVIGRGAYAASYRSSLQYPPVFVASHDVHDSRGGFTVNAALNPALADKLVVGGFPRTTQPLLLGLLLVTAAVIVVALLQVRTEHELAALRADFASSVSHELRTPLAQILLFAETLAFGRTRSEKERDQATGIIVQEARRLMHLVDNVLHFSRAERRVLRLSAERVPLAPLVREVITAFAPLAGSVAVNVRTDLDETIAAPVHRDAFHQLLLNLLDNAVKYGPPGQTVTVRVRFADGVVPCALIEVDDEGPGIAPLERDRVFKPYVRLAGARATSGSGIGLAVVREITAAHRGRVWAEESPTGGARFVVQLPDAERRVESGSTAASETSPLTPAAR